MLLELSQHGGQPHGGERYFRERMKHKVLGKAFIVEIEEKENQIFFFDIILERGLIYKVACVYFFCKLLCCGWDSGKEKCIISAKG